MFLGHFVLWVATEMRRWRRGGGDKQTTPAAASGAKPDNAATDEWQKKLEQYQLEQEEGYPDPRYSEEVEEDLKDNEVFEKEGTASEAEIRENAELFAKFNEFKDSEMARFLLRSAELSAQELAKAKLENATPTRPEDAKLWQQLPLVPGPYGGPPIPRKALKTDEEVQGRFWDFFKQFQFGLWGYRQRPYPPERPIDVQQVLGYKWLDKRYADCKFFLKTLVCISPSLSLLSLSGSHTFIHLHTCLILHSINHIQFVTLECPSQHLGLENSFDI